MKIDFNDEKTKPTEGDIAMIAYAYCIKFGVSEADKAAFFGLTEFLEAACGETYVEKAARLSSKLDGILQSYGEFAAAVLDNFAKKDEKNNKIT